MQFSSELLLKFAYQRFSRMVTCTCLHFCENVFALPLFFAVVVANYLILFSIFLHNKQTNNRINRWMGTQNRTDFLLKKANIFIMYTNLKWRCFHFLAHLWKINLLKVTELFIHWQCYGCDDEIQMPIDVMSASLSAHKNKFPIWIWQLT